MLSIPDGRANPLTDRKMVGMSNYPPVYPSIQFHPSDYPSFLSTDLSVCQPMHLSVFPSICLALYLCLCRRPSIILFLSVCPFVYLSFYFSLSRSVHFPVPLPSCGLSIHLAIYLLIQLSILSISVPKHFTIQYHRPSCCNMNRTEKTRSAAANYLVVCVCLVANRY